MTVEPGFKPSGAVPELLTIGDVASRARVATSTIRYYERRGLLSADARRSVQRRYRTETSRRIVFIGMMRDIGLTLDEVDGILHAAATAEWRPIAGQRLAVLDGQIAELQRARVARRRAANRAVAVSAVGLAATGLIELLLAILTGSVGLLGDAIHNLSDVSTSAVVFLGFRLSKRPASERYPYGMERAEDLAGIGVAVVIWASAAFAGFESVRKLIEHGHTTDVGWGIVGAAIGILGNQVVARYKLAVGRRIGSGTLIADAKHSWLDALSSAGALVGLMAVALGQAWGDPVAGLAITAFICHVGYEVTSDVVHRLADGVDPEIIHVAEAATGSVPGVVHAHVRARWTGRTLRVEIEGWVDTDLTARDSDALGREVAAAISRQLPEASSLIWASRAAPK